jgi:EAL domain-containing protein (putative c-di-GMP-specific phosphodiesterase class I)
MLPPLRLHSAEYPADSAGDSRYANSDVGRGLKGGEFRLVYQPKLHARRNAIDSVEALVRWDHPRLGMMLPDRFIDQCETSGTINELTLWTLERAISDQRELSSRGFPLRVFVNLSAQLLTEEQTVSAICALAKQSGVDLGIEVTESSVIADPGIAFANIRRLREAGLCIAIDDYGAGLSSLTYLKQIEADELKIDKSFVTSLGTSHRDPLIVRSTIDLAHALGMSVTAEGVETPAAHALLTVMGCDMMQGYLIGRPMRSEALVSYLATFDPTSIAVPADGRALRDSKIWKRA